MVLLAAGPVPPFVVTMYVCVYVVPTAPQPKGRVTLPVVPYVP
jgi:hypothetical protein